MTPLPRPEGTFSLDGLLEGPRPADPRFPGRLQEWLLAVERDLGLRFASADPDGALSLLADPAPLVAAALGPRPSERVRDAVAELLRALPAPVALASTLRSVEVRPGREVRTVYLVRPDGAVEAREREVEAVTRPPPRRPGALRVALVSAAVIAAVVGLASLAVDWRSILGGVWSR